MIFYVALLHLPSGKLTWQWNIHYFDGTVEETWGLLSQPC